MAEEASQQFTPSYSQLGHLPTLSCMQVRNSSHTYRPSCRFRWSAFSTGMRFRDRTDWKPWNSSIFRGPPCKSPRALSRQPARQPTSPFSRTKLGFLCQRHPTITGPRPPSQKHLITRHPQDSGLDSDDDTGPECLV